MLEQLPGLVIYVGPFAFAALCGLLWRWFSRRNPDNDENGAAGPGTGPDA